MHQSHDGSLEVTDPHGVRFIIHESLPNFPARQGISYMLLPCQPGRAQAVAAFYEQVLCAQVLQAQHGTGCDVVIGPGSHLRFREVTGVGNKSEKVNFSVTSITD